MCDQQVCLWGGLLVHPTPKCAVQFMPGTSPEYIAAARGRGCVITLGVWVPGCVTISGSMLLPKGVRDPYLKQEPVEQKPVDAWNVDGLSSSSSTSSPVVAPSVGPPGVAPLSDHPGEDL